MNPKHIIEIFDIQQTDTSNKTIGFRVVGDNDNETDADILVHQLAETLSLIAKPIIDTSEDK
ncbi:hypothetical protein JCM14076_06260 [Methylosoma difficile]